MHTPFSPPDLLTQARGWICLPCLALPLLASLYSAGEGAFSISILLEFRLAEVDTASARRSKVPTAAALILRSVKSSL